MAGGFDKLTAGWLVRAAAQRHLDDLATAHERDLVWLAPRAEGAINFFEQTLHLEADVPFKLADFQAFKVGSLYGWWRIDTEECAKRGLPVDSALRDQLRAINESARQGGPSPSSSATANAGRPTPGGEHAASGLPPGLPLHRRFRFAYWEEGKGNGKTPLAAGLGLLHLVMAFDSAPECYSAAAAKEQARIGFEDATRIVESSPALRKLVTPLANSLTIPASHARFMPLSSEDRGQHGKRVSFALLDEMHAHYSAKMARAMIAGTKNCRNALILIPTNSGHDRRSLCWTYHETARRILEREIRRDDFFAYVCTLDPCPKCRGAGWKQPAPQCPHCDQITDPAVWPKANPGLGTICRRTYVAERVEIARTQPSERADVLQLNFCLWVEAVGGWANMEQWDHACHQPGLRLEQFAGRRAALAMDAANKVDVTSLVAVVERAPGSGTLDPAALPAAAKAALAQATARQEGADPLAPDTSPLAPAASRALAAAGYAVFSWHFVPEEMVRNQHQENHEAYEEWQRSGELVVTPGAITDFSAVMAQLRELAALLDIVRFQYDPRDMSYFVQQLAAQEWCAFEIVELGQSPAMISQPMKELEALIAAGLLRHDGHRVLRWMLANVVQKSTSKGPVKYYFPTRVSEGRKIDGAVALIMALDGILRTAPEPAAPGMVVLG